MSTDATPGRFSWHRRLGRLAVGIVLGALVLSVTGWAVLALWFSAGVEGSVRGLLILAYSGVALGGLIWPGRLRGVSINIFCFAAVLGWWLSIAPSNDRDWQSDVAVLAHATISGTRVTIHDIRNVEYRSTSVMEIRHYDKTVDVEALQSVDLFLSYWGPRSIAHTILSFGFASIGRPGETDYICISIETRKEKGESYSAVRGFFRQYEIVYVVADERDVVRLRTNFRGEDVYLYRLRVKKHVAQDVFLDYMRRINELCVEASWYNALTANCTTAARGHTRPYTKSDRWDWRICLNGYIDEMAYESGALDTSLPFEELRKVSRINDRARAPSAGGDFSSRIRRGLPVPR